jgi:ribose transport system permease protein
MIVWRNVWAHQLPLVVIAGLATVFGLQSDRFLTVQNGINILVQASSAAVLAGGMSLVLITSGIDLSVGSLMFLCGAICGHLLLGGYPLVLASGAIFATGMTCGWLHGKIITRGRLTPFIVTMASLFILRGAGLWISRTRAMNLPETLTRWATWPLVGIPLPIWLAAGALALLHWLLTETRFGRQAVAVGFDPGAAHKAGVDVSGVLVRVYVLSGLCAALAALLSLAQLGAVSPTFGRDREFEAIAAAVLGGTSLFGGRGNILPGAAYGAVIVALVFNGLNLVNADPHLYPLITGGVIFLAVLLDTVRRRAVVHRAWIAGAES